jgi:hypothetical protein
LGYHRKVAPRNGIRGSLEKVLSSFDKETTKIYEKEAAMNFLRLHWFDLGIILALITGGFLLFTRSTGIALLLWLNLIALFLHQFEEYRYPGYFPGMMNVVMFGSQQPDRYPLNPQISLIVNLIVGWLVYFMAAVFGTRALWLGIAVILISFGNFIAHGFLFNIKGKTRYNPGMLVSIMAFLPLAVLFFLLVIQNHAASALDWGLGILLGLALNYVGILKMIDWMKDEKTAYIFPARFLIPGQRKE